MTAGPGELGSPQQCFTLFKDSRGNRFLNNEPLVAEIARRPAGFQPGPRVSNMTTPRGSETVRILSADNLIRWAPNLTQGDNVYLLPSPAGTYYELKVRGNVGPPLKFTVPSHADQRTFNTAGLVDSYNNIPEALTQTKHSVEIYLRSLSGIYLSNPENILCELNVKPEGMFTGHIGSVGNSIAQSINLNLPYRFTIPVNDYYKNIMLEPSRPGHWYELNFIGFPGDPIRFRVPTTTDGSPAVHNLAELAGNADSTILQASG